MAGSGLIMMFPVAVTHVLPGWILPVALIAHSDEAMLALTWIAMVHVFFNHFSPGSIPLNKSIFTGKVPAERYRREHGIDYDRIKGIDAAEQATAKAGAADVTDAAAADISGDRGTGDR